jgi:hypothetical protein
MMTNERENRPARTAVHRRGWLAGACQLAFCVALAHLAGAHAIAAEPNTVQQKADVTALTFNGTDFFHRWSQKGQHEFTPMGDEDLKAWKDMVTINVHDRARTGEALADVANRVLANYKANGHIMRTLSKPRTDTSEAEHFIAAVLQAPQIFEVAFARLLLFEGRAVVAVYSKRFYGNAAQSEMTTWFKANAVLIETVLVSWNGIPSRDTLNRLPQTP